MKLVHRNQHCAWAAPRKDGAVETTLSPWPRVGSSDTATIVGERQNLLAQTLATPQQLASVFRDIFRHTDTAKEIPKGSDITFPKFSYFATLPYINPTLEALSLRTQRYHTTNTFLASLGNLLLAICRLSLKAEIINKLLQKDEKLVEVSLPPAWFRL